MLLCIAIALKHEHYKFVNITYLGIVLIGYFHYIVYELHVTVHNNNFCTTVLHENFFHNTTVCSTHTII